MKFLNSSYSNQIQEKSWIYLNLLNQIDDLETGEDPQNLLQGGAGNSEGLLDGDSEERFRDARQNIQKQSAEATVQKSLEGGVHYWSGLLNPDRFKGYASLQVKLMDPGFWIGSSVAAKEVILSQLKRGMKEVGNPSALMGETPQLRGRHFKALVSEEAISSVLNNLHVGKPFMGRSSKISLSSLEFLEEVLALRLGQVNRINEDQFEEFTQKIEDEVWWKRWARKPLFQKHLYNAKFKRIKSQNELGHKELLAEIKSLKQDKEQQVFNARQQLDMNIQQAERGGDTKTLNIIRRTIHAILHNPEDFVNNSSAYDVDGFGLEALFGKRFSPVDVLEMLRDVKYEQLCIEDGAESLDVNYLESAISANQAKMSHYNSLRVVDGLQKRIRSLDQFDGTSLRELEKVIVLKYERGDIEPSLEDPKVLVESLISALGAATPGLLIDMHKVLGDRGDIYSASTELFWFLASFLGKNIPLFEKLPPKLQSGVAGFLTKKRDELEKPLVAGGVDEDSTFYFQAQALKIGGRVISSAKEALSVLPNITEKLKANEAQDDLNILSSFVANFDVFNSDIKDRIGKLPDFEQQALKNVLDFEKTAENIKKLFESLKTQQEEYQALYVSDSQLKQGEDRVVNAQELLNKASEIRKNGDENAKKDFIQQIKLDPVVGSRLSGQFLGGDMETVEETFQKELAGAQKFLQEELITKRSKMESFMFDDVPSGVGSTLGVFVERSSAPIKNGLHRMGLTEDSDLSKLLPDIKFDELARTELGEIVTRDVLKTANTLLQNDAVQQFKNLKTAEYTSLSQLYYAKAPYQTHLTTAQLNQPSQLKDLLFARKDADGSLWYHNKNQIVRITSPRLQDKEDQRNMAIWDKPHDQRDIEHCVVPNTQPSSLGIYLTANPENEAASKNLLYGERLESNVRNIQSRVGAELALAA